MTDATIRTLVGLEYDSVQVVAALETLASRLDCCRRDCPAAARAARELRTIRSAVVSSLHRLDGAVSEAVALAESLEPAPF